MSWKASTKNWIYMNTQANQVTLDIGGFSVGPAEIAEQLGFAVFKDDAELAAKFALGSNVGRTTSEGLVRIIIKSVKDIDGARAAPFSSVLQQAWSGFTG